MEVISSINLFLSVFYLSLLQQVFLIYHMLQSKHVCRWLTEIPCYVRTFNINDMSNSLGSFHEFFFVWYDILKCQAQYFLILLVNVTYFCPKLYLVSEPLMTVSLCTPCNVVLFLRSWLLLCQYFRGHIFFHFKNFIGQCLHFTMICC